MSDQNIPIDYAKLNDAPRLLLEAALTPLQGDRFQPTGFADLGPARYAAPDGQEMLLVESAQSVANRMELACCKEDRRTLLDELSGLPYVAARHKNEILTTSYLEAHRLSSPYLLNVEWATTLAAEMQLKDDYQINDKIVVATLFKYDPCSLLHGVWLGTKEYKDKFSGGRVRLSRIVSGFIEAAGIAEADSGGTKFDKNAARLTETGDAETGYGTLPFHRTEFTAKIIRAYFNLDLALLRGYQLNDNATRLLLALSLLKVRRFLSTGLRLRTACDLEVKGDVLIKRPEGFVLPSEHVLTAECASLISACKASGLFADPAVTEVDWEPAKMKGQKVEIELPANSDEPSIPEDINQQVKWKKGTKKAAPKLMLSEGLDINLAGRLKALFPNNAAIAKAIDEALNKQTSEASTADSTDDIGAN